MDEGRVSLRSSEPIFPVADRDVAVVERLPTPEEFQALLRAVGWASGDRTDRAARALARARFGVVAVQGEQVVGSGSSRVPRGSTG
jgi:hypothetical protein